MGLIRWILDNERHDARGWPSPARRLKAAGEAAWTNATHLVVAEPGHPRMGSFLRRRPGLSRPTPTKWEDVYAWCAWPTAITSATTRARWPARPAGGADLGWAKPADADEKWEDVYVVRLADGTLAPPSRPRRSCTSGRRGDARRTARPARWPCAAPCGCCARKRAARRWMSTPRSAACRRQDRRTGPALHQLRQARRGRCPRRHDERRGLLHRLCHRHAEHAGRQPERGGRAGAGRRSVSALWRGPTLQHRRLRQPRHAQGVGLSHNRFPYEKSSEFKRKKRRASRPIRPPRPGIRPPADSARKCWPRRWRATRTAPRSGSTTSNPVSASRAFARPWPTSSGSARAAAGRLDQSVHQRDQRAGRLHRAGHRDL